ncbi:hypothetical protein SAMN05216410_3362 [Sanguibacter gelidistatuariae]|uniref:STAS domain-containing protein n=1 Tax=Sanguibacter gelidistatuariae TaxID=1814289 RepID=A0A1G6UYX0_9MICO|nr:hypothetical protein [Sanguibacter gelidistatuariae]SDD46464.1 hypothetical protein SAMN05216410_3362 [Sanguibacter gelidistatuariae]
MSSLIAERTGPLAATGCTPGGAQAEGAWLTATIRPVGMICRCDADRLAVMLDALAGASSVVVLDLQAARIESARVADVIGRAAALLDARDGCLLCVGADGPTRACLERAGAPVAFVDPPQVGLLSAGQ